MSMRKVNSLSGAALAAQRDAVVDDRAEAIKAINARVAAINARTSGGPSVDPISAFILAHRLDGAAFLESKDALATPTTLGSPLYTGVVVGSVPTTADLDPSTPMHRRATPLADPIGEWAATQDIATLTAVPRVSDLNEVSRKL